MKIGSIVAAAVLTAGVATYPAPALAWPEGAPPSGSFTNSCKLYSYDTAKMRLTAACTRKNKKTALLRDWSYRYCVGDISNDNGMLVCTLDKTQQQADYAAAQAENAAKLAEKEAAKQAAKEKAEAEAAAAQMTGSKPGFDAAGIMTLGYAPSDAERAKFIALMKTPAFGMAEEAATSTISFGDASKFLRKLLVQPGQNQLRADTINLAFLSVWGRGPTPVEYAQADVKVANGQAWFAPIVLEQQGRMRADGALHAQLIGDAFDAATGREPSRGELTSWLAKPHDHSHAVLALRKWLYSAAGANERVETTRRALVAKGHAPTDDLLKQAMIEYGKTEAIYDEMLVSGPPNKLNIQPRRMRLAI